MLKRTKGRILLALLVVTGFAGTLSDNTLTKQERKFIVTQLKDTRTDLYKSVKDLSEKQLNYKQSPDQWNIKDCFFYLVQTEKKFWNMLESAMKEPADPEKRSKIKISDSSLLTAISEKNFKPAAQYHFQKTKAGWKSVNEAQLAFKTLRSEELKYAKTTTEDLRSHFIKLPFGMIDCYQFMIFISAHSNKYALKIEEIKANAGFPKN